MDRVHSFLSMENMLIFFSCFCCFSSLCAGILVNEHGVPEEEENFDEAIKAVNTALVPTRVTHLLC